MSMEEASCSSSSTIQLGGRAIDRHNPIIRDANRSSRTLSVPCSSQPPINPKPYRQLQKTKKSSSSSSKPADHNKKKSSTKPIDEKKKGVAKLTDHHIINKNSSQPTDIITKRWTKPVGDLITPPGSSRYLLSDTALSDSDPVLALVQVEEKKITQAVNQDESNASKPSSSSSSSSKTSSPDQFYILEIKLVVVLRVSLHCKGCEGKVRKHLSRMEGVTSFNIDFAAKKVTIIGDVTPVSVLASVSKVKNAQFWPSSISATSAPAGGSNNVETKK
nr:protein sodium potassium root defective 3 [Quercus suber]